MSGHPEAFDLLKSIIHLSNSAIPIKAKLDQMLQTISEAFGSDQCLFLRREKIVENGFLSRVASQTEPFWADKESPFSGEEIHPEEKDLLRPTFACIPLYDETIFQGILYIGFSEKQQLSSQEIDLLVLVAKEMGEAVRNAHLLQKMEQTSSELATLHEMGKVVTSTLKLEELLESIVRTGLKILKAKGGVLRILDRKTKELKVKWSLGDYHENPLDEKIAKRVVFTRTPFLLNHFSKGNTILSIVCAPLLSKEGSFGTLGFYDKETDPSKFDERDFQLLLTMANQMSCAIENAVTHYETSKMVDEHKKRVGQLSILWELNKALLTTVNFERILQITLTAITVGAGLGFNRAMLFMLNERNRSLNGTMAVGPDNAEEAGKIWNYLSQEKEETLSDLIAQILPSSTSNSILNHKVKGIQVPLEQEQCILSRTVLEGKSFNVLFPQVDQEGVRTRCERGCLLSSAASCPIGEHLSRDPTVYSFATVPLRGKGKVIGVILVDNLYNRNLITDEHIQILSMFSSQAGLAIENALLYRNLEEVHQTLKDTQTFLVHQEKMAALGELSATVAHEIRNPLVSIGGFARRLYRTIPDEAPEKRYTQTIMIEVSRMEEILNNLLNYTRDESLVLKEVDLQDILEESLSMVSEKFDEREIELVKEYAEELPKVIGDHQQLKQVFFNLFINAYQAMSGKGRLSLRVHPVSRNGASFIRVEVEDTGSGIDPENLYNIFNPFYSTKESGLGLGLPLIYKIITSHRGQIEVDNHPGEGVTFIITLPVAPLREGKMREVDQ